MAAWLNRYDFELDILPGIARARERGIAINSYQYFNGSIDDVHRERTAAPEVNHDQQGDQVTNGRVQTSRPSAGRGRRKGDGFIAGLRQSLAVAKVA
jgi:hypothetical protein